jgi:hypothetical protein
MSGQYEVKSMSFSVKLSPTELVKRRLVSGPIWLEMGGQAFPIDAWYDFPVVILGWWLSNLKPLVTNQSTNCECPFMDGPYRFDVTVRKRRDWTVTFIRDELAGEKRLLEDEVDPQTLISEVISAANLAIEVCKQNEWISDDLITLEKEVGEMKGLTRSFL